MFRVHEQKYRTAAADVMLRALNRLLPEGGQIYAEDENFVSNLLYYDIFFPERSNAKTNSFMRCLHDYITDTEKGKSWRDLEGEHNHALFVVKNVMRHFQDDGELLREMRRELITLYAKLKEEEEKDVAEFVSKRREQMEKEGKRDSELFDRAMRLTSVLAHQRLADGVQHLAAATWHISAKK